MEHRSTAYGSKGVQDNTQNKVPKILTEINVIQIKLCQDLRNTIISTTQAEAVSLVSKILSRISVQNEVKGKVEEVT